MRTVRRWSLILLVLVPWLGYGQTSATPELGHQLSPAWQARCQEALKTPLPAEATAAPIPDSAGQSAAASYYGIWGWKWDYDAARRTAWQERARSSAHPGSDNPFRGSMVLAMIYANGLGTPRDTALALRMGCEATAYRDGLKDADLDRLQAALRGPACSRSDACNAACPCSQYDVCSAVPPEGKNNALCGQFELLTNRQRVVSSIAALMADWTVEQKSLMRKAEDTEDRFSRSYSVFEAPPQAQDDGSSGSDVLHQRQKAEFDDAFLGGLQWMCAQKADNRNFVRDNRNAALLDADLNLQYNILMDKLREKGITASPNATDERRIEREWIAFRDAWVAFVKARFGADEAEHSREQMTGERLGMLRALSARFDPPAPEAARLWHRICADARTAALPADFPPEPVKPKSTTCTSYGPYYGIGGPVDFKAARICAISERNEDLFYSPQGGESSEIKDNVKGSVVLAMLYANGQGVARNVRLAQRFGCEAIDFGLIDTETSDSAAPEEEEEATATGHLNFLRAFAATEASQIDLCGDVWGPTRAVSQCAQIAHALEDWKRTMAFNALRAKLTAEQKAAFDKLMTVARAFISASVYNEVAMIGHGVSNGGLELEYSSEEAAFLADMQRFEHGDLPHATVAQYAADDHALNAAYAKAMANLSDEEEGEGHKHRVGSPATRQSVRETERAWIVYRDALADFGALWYPKAGRAPWLAYVTQKRTKDLSGPCLLSGDC